MSWRDVKELALYGFTVDQQRRIIVGALLILYAAHTAWAHGLLFWEEGGFVHREDVQAIANTAAHEAASRVRQENMNAINSLRSQLIEAQIREDHILRCRSEDERLREELEIRIGADMEVFREINGYYYRLTPCSDL